MKKYSITNKYTKALYSFDTRAELDAFCEENGLKLNTMERALREGRESLTGWSLIKDDNVSGERTTVMLIGDLHLPFEKEGYFDFCLDVYNRNKCNKVIFAGDLLDNHSMSYHETHQDAYGAKDELEKAKAMLKKWYEAFPDATVMIGNHDALPMRKSQTGGITKHWIKSYAEVLETDTWAFLPETVVDGVLYLHGTGRKARARCMQDNISVAQGHYHSESYVEYFVGSDGNKKFACQVGCGVDIESYAMEYGKAYAKPHINVAVIKNGHANLEYMN